MPTISHQVILYVILPPEIHVPLPAVIHDFPKPTPGLSGLCPQPADADNWLWCRILSTLSHTGV